MSISVLLADDQRSVRAGVRALLQRTPDITVVGEAADGDEAVALTAELRPDVVLMDIRMPGRDGIDATRAILTGHATDLTVHVIVLTTFDLDEYVFAAMREGASGFLTKNAPPDEIRRAVRVAADGQGLLDPAVTRRVIAHFAQPRAQPESAPGPGHETPPPRETTLDRLTPREREVARLIATGLTNEEISKKLFLSTWTVKTHVGRILTKLDVRERAQIVIAVYEAGDVTPGS